MSAKHSSTHVAIWVLALLPAVVAAAMLRSPDLASPGGMLNFLGRLTGIGGLSLMLVAAVLSCRVPGFDRPFGGLTKLWRTHHRLAAASFVLLLAHPLLLTFAAAEARLDAAFSTLFRHSWPLWAGWAALLLLMVFLAPSFKFFGEPRYQRWKHLHRLAVPAVILALVHTLYLARTLPWPVDTLIWLGLTALAVASMSYRFIYGRTLGRRRYRVGQVTRPANNVVEISLSGDGKPLRHDAGQFVYLTPFDPALPAGRGEEHPYTLSSAPGEPELRIAIKDLGDASRAIQHITPGSEVAVEGPYGALFPAVEAGQPELWIAGGIGITPFLARARHLVRSRAAADAVLVFCVQDEARALFADELRQLSEQQPGLRLQFHYFYQHGPLDLEFVQATCPDAADRCVYACGPRPLLDQAHHIARQLRIPHDRVVTEEFNLL
ncbi:MAG: ferric reductase-like transmembrane domain-containing protein [Pseudomonadales bacterium]